MLEVCAWYVHSDIQKNRKIRFETTDLTLGNIYGPFKSVNERNARLSEDEDRIRQL